jgi:hypothetical protein
LLIIAVVTVLALQGPGQFSLDALWGTALPGIWAGVALAVVLLGWGIAVRITPRAAKSGGTT